MKQTFPFQKMAGSQSLIVAIVAETTNWGELPLVLIFPGCCEVFDTLALWSISFSRSGRKDAIIKNSLSHD